MIIIHYKGSNNIKQEQSIKWKYVKQKQRRQTEKLTRMPLLYAILKSQDIPQHAYIETSKQINRKKRLKLSSGHEM